MTLAPLPVEPDVGPGEVVRGPFPSVSPDAPIVPAVSWPQVYAAFGQAASAIGSIFDDFFASPETTAEAQQLQIDRNIVLFMHATNMKVAGLIGAVDRTGQYLAALGEYVDRVHDESLWIEGELYHSIQQIQTGTLPGTDTLTSGQLAQVQALIDQSVRPLYDNLGQVTAQVQQLAQQVTELQSQTDPNRLNERVTGIESFLSHTLNPLLGPIVATLSANLPARMLQEEECCAANSGFKDDWSSLLDKLRPLLQWLSLVDTVALLALLEHIWSEGLPGFVREIEGIVSDHLSDVENLVGPFVGL